MMNAIFRLLVIATVILSGLFTHPASFFRLPNRSDVPSKQRSGVHLGLRPWADWNESLLSHIDPQHGGIWPDVIVLLSDQFYNVVRDPETHRITGVTSGRPALEDYLQRATAAGVHLIIRIQPSPGNFLPDSAGNHRLLLTAIDYTHGDGNCMRWENNCHRSPDDIADHIVAIHDYNIAHGISEWGFEPANEPNIEWYDYDPANTYPDTAPNQAQALAWQDMDAYFQAIYAVVKDKRSDVRILTPPMSQGQYAEGYDTLHASSCLAQRLDSGTTGYDEMYETYANARDAVSWHNYWRLGYEEAASCTAAGQHISYYFPTWLKSTLEPEGSTEGFITEADLLSPQQDPGQIIRDKDEMNGVRAADSIRKFMWYEMHSQHMASWLLNDLTGNAEFGWHEAHQDTDADTQQERAWFTQWWFGPEGYSPPTYLPLLFDSNSLP